MKLRPRTLFFMLAGAVACGVVLLTARRDAGTGSNADITRNVETPTTLPDPEHFIECSNVVVVSVSADASEAGLEVLKEGGNAVDASIATLFALVAAYPAAGNIGGGGFMVVHPGPGGEGPVVFDYRECA